MKIINILLDMLLISLSFLLPKKSNSFLLGSAHGIKMTGNPKYFYYYIIQKSEIDAFWITENKELFNYLKTVNLPVVYKYSLKAFIKILRSQFLIIEQMPKDILFYGQTSIGNFKYIQTFHGIAIKKIGLDAGKEEKGIAGVNAFQIKIINHYCSIFITWVKKILLYKNYTSIIVTSNKMKEISRTAFNNYNIQILGYPRNDIFFQTNNYKPRIKNLHDQFEKIICYIPTFRDNYKMVSPFSDDFYIKFNTFLKQKKWFFAIKKHPYEINMTIPHSLSNIKDVSSDYDDVQELLIETDILITDYSSVANDFCMTGKPIIFYNYDMIDYIANCRGFYYNYEETYSGPFAENETILMNYIQKIDMWSNEDSYKLRYKKMVYFFNHYNDGLSSERLFNYLTSSIL